MAKKEKDFIEEENETFEDEYDEYEEEKKPKKKKGCLIMVILSVIIIAILVAILGFNAGGIRDKYLRNTLEKIPIVKNLLPPLEEENLNNEEQVETVSKEQETINALTLEIENLNAEIKRLKAFEENQIQFKAEKEEFDRMIASNDPKAYSEFYESIAPENAEKLYQEAVQKAETDKQFKDYISTFENMKKDSAAKILEELIMTDMDLVVTILENLSSTKRSEILTAMDAKNAAACAKLLSSEIQ
ncbi:MAG: hypothetical protein K2L15_01865 [Eubacteriales bacterium]|nr:hypothetical protein [Eubacteriales bacterium]